MTVERTTEDAWKLLDVVVGWVKHAEAKAVATLAAAGVIGGLLYNVVRSEPKPSFPLDACAALCGILVLVAAVCSACALWPRLRLSGTSRSLLYFAHIARDHEKDEGAYVEAFRTLADDQDKMLGQLASQIWSNSRVATQKYWWSNLALVALLLSVGTIASTAGLAFLES
ncbi:MAG: hypothetical protein DLM61_14255 [Pseudonocardiales bacterium]|nr:MAG: hypothetical protein DLM61_14255 [Pseudonocardiales bacterium]